MSNITSDMTSAQQHFIDKNEMHVTKRNGNIEIVSFDKILMRIKKIGQEVDIKLNYTNLAMKVIDQLYDKISTTKIDELSAEQCASMASIHPDYNILAGRIVVSNHHKNTPNSFTEAISLLYKNVDVHGNHTPLVSDELYSVVNKYPKELDAICDYKKDYLIEYFGFKTLERAYLMKINGKPIERPQHMWLRVSIGIHGDNLPKIVETYDLMSKKYFTHATPTLFNAGTPHPQLSSCFLIAMEEDSMEGIYSTLKDCAMISKWSGGIGLHIHNIRAAGSKIRGTNGASNGIVPMLKVFNNTAKYANQGGKRNGSFAIYLEPWHADLELFLQMRKNHGDEELKARDLFYALWMPDLFMERVKTGGQWTFMCPDECPGLSDVWGDEFKALYTKYESEGRGRKTVLARDIWFQILDSQMETGTPYLVYKDAANKKSNQKNVGTIKSSNLCVAPETLVLTDRGHLTIKDLEGHTVNVWNGEEWSKVTIRKTGMNQELITVYTDDGGKLSCTPYHKFYIEDEWGNTKCVEARHLKSNDVIIKCSFPIIDNIGKQEFSTVQWFQDFCQGYSVLYRNKEINENYLVVYVYDYNTAYTTKLKMQTYGINIKIKNYGEEYRLIVYPDDLDLLINHGFSLKNIKHEYEEISENINNRMATTYSIKITRIENNNRVDDTYCFTEPLRHMGVFNGILTGQCSEIIEYSDNTETAVCNLGSIALPAFIDNTRNPPVFNYEQLHHITRVLTYNLNRIIDVNFYPTEKTKKSNMRHRPIGIGVQGLADVFMMMNVPFHSDEAKVLNRNIFETIYHGALEESTQIAVTEGPYETFEGSPASQGILQFDMWNVDPGNDRYDWNELKTRIQQQGLRNSLLLAPMPTASTSQILGYNECIEPITSNIYSRRTLAGEFIIANKYLMNDLIQLELWNEKIKNNIIANNGSIQQIDIIPEQIRNKYKTVWEMPMRQLIDMAADRGAFICQSQSLNLWLEDPNYSTLTSMHFYAWSKGLKTGIYYLRRRARHQAQQFTIEVEKKVDNNHITDEDTICESCSA